MMNLKRAPLASVLLVVAAVLPSALGFCPSSTLVPASLASCRGMGQGVAREQHRLPIIFAGSRMPLRSAIRQAHSGPKLRMVSEDAEKTGPFYPGVDVAVNEALKLLVSRRAVLGAAAATAAVASMSSPPAVEAASQGVADDAFGEGILMAPGKLTMGPPVEKSPADLRSYRALTLPNGLRVLLASDPTTNKAAAALDVHVGHFSDPENVAGLAHFCEHMLFLGTEKYPQEGALEKFLSVHGGSSNAYTDTEDTNFFFDVNEDSLESALDIFSQFFVAPLFTASATDRELNAIESEHSKNLQTDSWRINQVGKLRGNQAHPFHKFGTGNRYTLKDATKEEGINLRDELLAYHKRYYSANQMTLVVCGKEDLDALQKMVVSRFSAVPNADRATPEVEWQGKIEPFGAEASKTVFNIVPVQDTREIYLAWILPFKSANERLDKAIGKPQYAVSSILGYEGKGSLLSYLKDTKGWVTSLGASEFDSVRDFDIYGMSVTLTTEGQKVKDAVVETIFAYIDKLKKEGIPDYIGKDLMELNGIYWKFQERTEPQNFCTSAAANMHRFYDPKMYISGPQRVTKVDAKEVASYVGKLSADRCLVTYISRDAKSDKSEKWYGTKYSTEPVGERLAEWSNPKPVPELKIPPPNPFIPKDFTIKEQITETSKDPVQPPTVVLDNERWRLHYKPDKRYGKPKAYAFFQFTQGNEIFGEKTTPRTSAFCKLFRESLGDALNEYSYDASAAGLQYQMSFTVKGPEITFSGYNDKLPDFVKYISSAVAQHMPSDEDKFNRYKDSISRQLTDFVNDQPYRHAVLFSRVYTDAPSYTPLEVLEELKTITLPELQDFVKQVFRRMYGEALVQGNINKKQALAMVEAMDVAFKFDPIAESDRAVPRATIIPLVKEGYGTLLQVKEPNPNNPNSAVVVQIQSSNRDVQHQMGWEVLASMIEQPFYNSLRTKQQLGYIVGAGIKAAEGARSLTFTVQSSVADASYLTQKTFEFFEEFAPTMDKMTDAEFKVYVDGIVREKLEQEQKLAIEASRHWGEIQGREYVYDRAQREAAALKTVTKEQVAAIFRDYVLPKGAQRRVFVAGVESQVPSKERIKGQVARGVEAKDPKAFRSTNGYLTKKTVEISNILKYEPLRKEA